MFRVGRPVLVGTTSVENSKYLSSLLRESMIPHNLLNARPKYDAGEAQTVAQAGRKYAITIYKYGWHYSLYGHVEKHAEEINKGYWRLILRIFIGDSAQSITLAEIKKMSGFQRTSLQISWIKIR